MVFSFEGKAAEDVSRDGYLNTLDNRTREYVEADIETWTTPVILALCFLIGIVSNGALFYTICKDSKLRNVPNSFILSIAFSNIILLLLCIPLVASASVLRRWPFDSGACKMIQSIPQASLAISMLSLVGLSIERYAAFSDPPKHRSTAKNRACIGLLFIWIIGAICGLPLAIFAFDDGFAIGEEKITYCTPFSNSWIPLYPQIHTIVSAALIFGIPLVIVFSFYLSLGCVICAKKQVEVNSSVQKLAPSSKGDRSSRSGTLTKTSTMTKTNTFQTGDTLPSTTSLKKRARRRRTMAKVVLFLTIQFTIFWTPTFAYHFRYYFFGGQLTAFWKVMRLGGTVAVFLNAALVPFTVVAASKAFKHQLGKYLCCCFSCLNCCCGFCKSRGSSSAKSAGCCFWNSGDSDSSDSSADGGGKHIPDIAYSHGPVYHEVKSEPMYDSYHRPPTAGSVHSNQYQTPSIHHSSCNGCTRGSYALAVNQNGHPSSHYGDNYYSPYDEPKLLRMHPVESEVVDGAEAPKFSKVFVPKTSGYVDTAQSIVEHPAF